MGGEESGGEEKGREGRGGRLLSRQAVGSPWAGILTDVALGAWWR